MPYQDEQHPENKLDVLYCDGSQTARTYLTTAWGNINARDDFHDFVKMGQENDRVWAKLPHVVKVEVYLAQSGTVACEEFRCACKKEKVRA